MAKFSFVAGRLFETPLAIHRGKAAAIISGIGPRILGAEVTIDGAEMLEHVAFSGGRPSDLAGKLGDPLGRRLEARQIDALDVVDSVAIIAIEGTLIHKGKWIGSSSGETSYEGLQTQIRLARQNPAIKGVVFEIDSPGGEVSGAFDTAAMIRQLSAEKPTMAILTDHALSAGYLLASGARQIVAPETGRAGSIGMIMLHADQSKALDRVGVKVSVLSAGKHKGEGNPFEPLPDDVAQRIRGELEEGRRLFAGAVAQGRGSRMTSASALETEADDFSGRTALGLGLIDAVGHPSEAFDEFVTAIRRISSSITSPTTGANRMSNPAFAASRAVLGVEASSSPAAQGDGVASARADERQRINAIMNDESAKGREPLARHFAFETDLPVDMALKALKASPVEGKRQGSPLSMAMASLQSANLGPGGELAAGVQPKTIDAAAIYARRAAAKR